MLALFPVASFAQSNGQGIKRLSTGVIVPNRSVTLSAKIMGRVNRITRDEGDKVKKGELLLSVDDAELRADLDSAKASLGLSKADAEHKKKLESKMKRLFEEKSISEDMVDQAVLNHVVAREKVKMAQAQISKVKALLKETKIHAPFDAVVIKKSVEIGHVTSPGQALFVIEDHSRLKFRMSVREGDVPHIKIGDRVKVTIDALGDEALTGKVLKIIPSGDTTTHSFQVEVSLPSRKNLYVGMFGKAEF